MQQFTRKPVTVFKSTDANAPQLSYNTAGDFKTLLKACLKTGYGSKTALGWDIVAEDTNRIAFKSADAASTKSVLWVDDSNGATAHVKAYESMSDLDTGVGKFEYRYHANWRFYPKSSTAAASKKNWVLVGHDSAFIIVSWAGSTANAHPLFFGDFPSFKPADQFNCALLAWLTDAQTHHDVPWSVGLGTTDANFWAGSISRQHTQTGKTGAGVLVSAEAPEGGYPDAISGGWMGATAYIKEGTAFRGILPGICATRSFDTGKTAQFNFAAEMPQQADTGDKFIWVRQPYYSHRVGFGINTTAWLSA